MKTVKFGGNEYKISYPFASFCALQDTLGIDDLGEVFSKMTGGNFKLIAAMLWAGLLASDDTVTLQDAYKIIDLANEGELATATIIIAEEFTNALTQKIKKKETNTKNAISPASPKK